MYSKLKTGILSSPQQLDCAVIIYLCNQRTQGIRRAWWLNWEQNWSQWKHSFFTSLNSPNCSLKLRISFTHILLFLMASHLFPPTSGAADYYHGSFLRTAVRTNHSLSAYQQLCKVLKTVPCWLCTLQASLTHLVHSEVNGADVAFCVQEAWSILYWNLVIFP